MTLKNDFDDLEEEVIGNWFFSEFNLLISSVLTNSVT